MKRENRRTAAKRNVTIILVLSLLLVIGIFASVFIGQFSITPRELAGILFSGLLKIKPFWSVQQEHVLLTVRFPRILAACAVGLALSTAGCVYQGVFENPMAAPDFLGASSGAAFGAAVAILLGMSNAGITGLAFVVSLLTVWVVHAFGKRTHGNKTVGLVLAGLMVSALAQAGTSFVKLVADQANELPAITYWLMGSLTGITMNKVLFACISIAIGLIPLMAVRWKINLLTVGEQEAATMGINVSRLRLILLACATLLTAAAVSVSGIIGWVGLIVPHFCRKLVGNNYKYLMPASVLTGALFLLLVDDVSRSVFAIDFPIGILTAVIGAPFFIYLITKGGEAS